MTYIRSEAIYAEDGLKRGYLAIEGGKFAGITDSAPAGAETVDYGALRVIPGIVDTHNHGTCGYSLMSDQGGGPEADAETMRGYLKGCAAQGVTAVFPTTIDDGMIAAAAQAAQTAPDGAQVVGIHSEGPWLNRTGEKGIWTPWPEVSLDRAKRMVESGAGLLKLVAMAPEIDGIGPVAEYFLSRGVTIAFAHSDANYAAATEAYDKKGFSVATHTGNVMSGMHHRDVGGLGASLLNDKAECEVICDGMHICLDMLRVYFKVKDYSRFMMISDCTPLSGAPPGRYEGVFQGVALNVTPEGFVLSDTGRLCGSSQPVLFGIGNLVEKLGIDMGTVVKMAALNACRKYGLAERKGSIAPGKDADFVVIDKDYHAAATYVRGKKVYDAEADKNVFNPDFLRA